LFQDNCSEQNSENPAEELTKKKHRTCRKEDNSGIGDHQFQDPVYKKLAIFNGEVNRLTKDELKAKLIELHLDPR